VYCKDKLLKRIRKKRLGACDTFVIKKGPDDKDEKVRTLILVCLNKAIKI
jgi:hypothetical protein